MLHEFALRLRFKDFCNIIGPQQTWLISEARPKPDMIEIDNYVFWFHNWPLERGRIRDKGLRIRMMEEKIQKLDAERAEQAASRRSSRKLRGSPQKWKPRGAAAKMRVCTATSTHLPLR
jgi:hypothetical protein